MVISGVHKKMKFNFNNKDMIMMMFYTELNMKIASYLEPEDRYVNGFVIAH